MANDYTTLESQAKTILSLIEENRYLRKKVEELEKDKQHSIGHLESLSNSHEETMNKVLDNLYSGKLQVERNE